MISFLKNIFNKLKLKKSSLSKEKSGPPYFIFALIFILLLIFAWNLNTVWSFNKDSSEKEAKEELARLEVIYIKDKNCADCFDTSKFVTALKQQKVEIKKEETLEFDAKKAKDLIKKLAIEKIPTVLVKGELEKTEELKTFWKSGGEIKDKTFVFTKVLPPYVKTADGSIAGKLVVTYLKDNLCEKCANLETKIIEPFKKGGIFISETKTVESTSEEGKTLISQYQITKIPALIFPKETEVYENLKNVWSRYGTVEPDVIYVLRNANPPYKDLATGEVKGLVTLTILSDKSCSECYDPSIHLSALKNLGLVPNEEKSLDINEKEGQVLVSKYKINLVPTIILSEEAKEYLNLVSVWPKVGTTEADGIYVFREGVKSMGTYKDLDKNEVIKPPTQTP